MIQPILIVALAAALIVALVAMRRHRPRARTAISTKRILVPFTGGALDPTVLDAAIRIAHAEEATLVPAYLIVVPFEFSADAPMGQQVGVAMPLLEAVEHAALRAGVPVDARVESGRSPIHALQRLWAAEQFDRIVVPAPVGRAPGFTPKDLAWMLTQAPSETLILRPDPIVERAANGHDGPPRISPSAYGSRVTPVSSR
ncbi:MAG TPA: universal stress protein [Gaiellaceae bacterium]|nr:universal stress protein [Gaiellaceae bacterium]